MALDLAASVGNGLDRRLWEPRLGHRFGFVKEKGFLSNRGWFAGGSELAVQGEAVLLFEPLDLGFELFDLVDDRFAGGRQLTR